MDSYDQWADIYDFQVPPKEDIPFYLKQAEGLKGRILELTAGTGRVTIPLARAGHQVRGRGIIDLFSFDPVKAAVSYSYDLSGHIPITKETLSRIS